MTRQLTEGQQNRLRGDGARLRRHLAEVATAIACTEDHVADTLERMALALPEDAARLLAHAAQARRYAVVDRGRAGKFGSPA